MSARLRLILLFAIPSLLAVGLVFLGTAHGQTIQKNPFVDPPHKFQPHTTFKAEKFPLLGKAASSFMKHHGKLCNFLGNIDIEYDKPHKLNPEKRR
jgi:hypothetical protein